MDWGWTRPLETEAHPRYEPHIHPVNGIVQPPVVPPPSRPGRRTNVLDSLKSALGIIWKSRLSYYFRHPVDAISLGIPDYHNLIKYPMDLSTIRKRLQNNYYWRADEAMDDFELIIENCLLYNQEGTEVHTAAKELREAFYTRLDMIDMSNEVEIVPQTGSRKRKAEPVAPIISSDEKHTVCTRQQKPKLSEQQEIAISNLYLDAHSEPHSDSHSEPQPHTDPHPETEPASEPESEPEPEPLTEFQKLQLKADDLLDWQEYLIEKSHCESLLKCLTKQKRAHHNWPFNNCNLWRIYCQNHRYDCAEAERLDWQILAEKLANNHFDNFDHFVRTIRKMFNDALACFPLNRTLIAAVNETNEVFESRLDQYRDSIAVMKDKIQAVSNYMVSELNDIVGGNVYNQER